MPDSTAPAAPIPPALTPLIGRVTETDAILDLLATPGLRSVTITGAGGVGKTRLAMHVATLIAGQREVVFVPLAAVATAELVVPAILQAMGVYMSGTDEPMSRLAESIADRPCLLVLDNVEHVRAAVPDLVELLTRCPEATLLATSRAPLGISGEHRYLLAPLPGPIPGETDPERVMATDAAALFLREARAVNPGFALDERNAAAVADICRRLDGLPLAIELAAARTRILTPEALRDRLADRLRVLAGERRDQPDRLRTLRNAIAWSYDLLGPDEQAMFRRLAVFAGTFSLEAAEAVAPAGIPAFDVLSALVDHSLVQPVPVPTGETRFALLETLRDFGIEQLDRVGETDAARLAHATWYVALAEAAEPHLVGRDQAAWLERLLPETDNIRAAATWSLDSGREILALRLVTPLVRFFSSHGLAREAQAWLRAALAVPSTRDAPGRASVLIGAGSLHEDLQQLDAAGAFFEEARDVATRTGDVRAECQALLGLGMIAHDTGDYATALPFHERALELARAIGDRHLIARSLGNLGAVSYFQGRLDDAERYWEEARTTLAALGDTITEAVATSNLGALAFERADLDRSAEMHRRALALQRRLRSTRDLPYTLINLGGVATLQGEYALAHACIGEAIALARSSGNTAVEGVAFNTAAGLALAEGRVVDAASLVMESVRLVADVGYQHAVVEDAELLAEACTAHGSHAAGAELLTAAATARRALGAEPTPFKREEIARIDAAIRAGLDDNARALAEAAGSALDLDALPRRMATLARAIVGERQGPVEIPPVADQVEAEAIPVEHSLTAREAEVLRLLADGLSTEAISDRLFISPRTVTTHMTHILAKLGVPTRTAAVALALREGIV